MRFVIWENADGSSSALTPADQPQPAVTAGSTPREEIEADTWEEAVRIYDERLKQESPA